MSGRSLRVGLLLVGVLAGLAGAELLLRCAMPGLGRYYYVWAPHLQKTLHPTPDVMPGVSGTSRFAINSMGIRGEEFADDQQYRILAVGGSATECFYLDQQEAWPALLETRLNALGGGRVWVGNVGMSGRNTREHLLQLRYLLPQYPRIDAVVCLIGVNDFLMHAGDQFGASPAPGDAGYEQHALQRAFYIRPYGTVPRSWRDTALWRLGRRMKDLYVHWGERQDADGMAYVAWRRNRQQAPAVIDQLPDLTTALEEYARNINQLIDLARARGVRLILLTQPAMWRADLTTDEQRWLWLGAIRNSRNYYSARVLAEGLERFNGVLRQVCQSRGVECVDMAARLPKDLTAFYDDVHLNERGAQLVADALADYVGRTTPVIAAGRTPGVDQARAVVTGDRMAESLR